MLSLDSPLFDDGDSPLRQAIFGMDDTIDALLLEAPPRVRELAWNLAGEVRFSRAHPSRRAGRLGRDCEFQDRLG